MPGVGSKRRRNIFVFALAAICAILFIEVVILYHENEKKNSFAQRRQEKAEDSHIERTQDGFHHHSHVFMKSTKQEKLSGERSTFRTMNGTSISVGKMTPGRINTVKVKSKGTSDVLFI